MGTTGWARTRDNFQPRSTRCTARTRSSSDLTAVFTRSITFRPMHPMASSPSITDGSYRLPGRNRRLRWRLHGQFPDGPADPGLWPVMVVARPMKSSSGRPPQITSMASSCRTTGRPPKLTLNLGLRYDVTLPRTDRDNRQNWFDPNVPSPLNGGNLTYTDPVTGPPVTVPLNGGEVFASSEPRTTYATDWHATFSRALALPTNLLRRR